MVFNPDIREEIIVRPPDERLAPCLIEFPGRPGMICDRRLEIWVMVVNAVAFSILALLHFFGTYVVYASRKTFHPFFVMFFIPFIFLYVVCDVLPITYDIAKRNGIPDEHPLQAYTLHVWIVAYRSVTPIVISFLVERLYATVNHSTYEKARPIVFPLLLPFGVLLATADDLGMSWGYLSINVEQYSLLAVEGFILLLLYILYLVNRRLVAQYTGKGLQLTARYQLVENVRVLRLVILVVIIDGLVTINNILAQVLFGVASSFSMEDCEKRPIYFPAYVFMNTVSLSIAGTVTLAIVYGHPAITKASRNFFHFESTKIGVEMITNALGGAIKFSNTAHEYFDGLHIQWK